MQITVSEDVQTKPVQFSEAVLKSCFMIMGMGTLFAYNAFVSCIDYFEAINPSIENVSGQMVSFQLTAMFVVTLALLPFSTLIKKDRISSQHERDLIHHQSSSLSIRLSYHSKRYWSNIKPWIEIAYPENRVLFGFVFTFLFLLVFLILPHSPNMVALNVFSTFIGIADAMSQSGLYVLAASYDKPSYSAAVTMGGALSGFIVSILRLITRSLFDTSTTEGLRKGANLLIWIAFGFEVVLITTVVLVKRDQDKYKAWRCLMHHGNFESELQGHDYSDDEIDSHMENSTTDLVPTSEHNLSTLNRQSSLIMQVANIYRVTFFQVWKPIVSAFLNFFITLSLFPGVVVSIPTSSSVPSLGNWLAVVNITVFNGADCLGRYICMKETWIPFRLLLRKHEILSDGDSSGPNHGCNKLVHYNKLVWYPTIMRIIFFPLFGLCIVRVVNDLLSCLVVFLFGLSSGFIHCSNFTVAPTVVRSEESKNATSLLLLLSIFIGLCGGAYFGLAVENIISGFQT